jgi:CHASE2 domain-containing sensor protein
MLKRLSWLCRSPAVVIAAALLLAGACFGSTRDFAAFLLSIPVLATLLVGALFSAAWAAFSKVERGRDAVAAVSPFY